MGNNFKTTLALLVAAVSLSAYAHFFEREPVWDRPVGGVFTDLKFEDIVELEVIPGAKASSGAVDAAAVPVLLRYEAEAPGMPPEWHIVKPFPFAAFVPRIEGIITSIIELQRINPVNEGGKESAFFDENSLEATVRFKTRGAQPVEHRIEAGKDFAIEGLDLVYVRIDGKETLLTRKGFKKSINARLDELRSRALFPVSKELAVRVEIQRGADAPMVVERKAGTADWQIQPPYRGTADRSEMDDLLDGLNAWRIESFASNQIADPALHGLDRPAFAVSLTNRRGQVFRYQIGEDPQGKLLNEVYVRSPDLPFLFTARKDLVRQIDRAPENFRLKYFLQFGAEEIVEVRGAAGAGNDARRFRLWKASPDAGASKRAAEKPIRKPVDVDVRDWKVEDERLQATYAADPALVREFLKDVLKNLPVFRFMDDPAHPQVAPILKGEAAPILTFNIRMGAGAELRPVFYAAQPADDLPRGALLARLEGSDEVMLVTRTIPAGLWAGGIYFRDRQVPSLPLDAIEHFTIGNVRTTWSLARIQDTWHVGNDDHVELKSPEKDVDQEKAKRVIRSLARDEFRVLEFLPEEKDLARLELLEDRFQLMVEFDDVPSEPGFRRILIGAFRDQSPAQEYYAKISTVEMPVLVEKSLVEAMAALVANLKEITVVR